MIVLDIDQDYFFLPVLSGKLLKDPQERNAFYHEAPVKYQDIIRVFGLNSSSRVKILTDHDEVYHEINKLGGCPKVIHIDAHDDVCHKNILNNLDIGNWLTYLVMEKKIDPDIIWINQLTEKPFVYEYNILNQKYRLHTSQLSEFTFTKKIDYVFFTRSKEFCPDTSIEFDFINALKNIP
jgi:hypothetical protein